MLRRHLPVLVGLVAVSVISTLWNLRGVLDQWSTAVPTRIDNRFQAWVIHWVQGALMGEHSLYDASTFAPAAASLTFSDHLIGLSLVLLPLQWLGLSPVAVFNTAIVLGGVANAVAGYVLGYVLTRRRAAAVVASAVFAVGAVPWLATMHVNLVWRSGLALVVAGIWVLADRASGRWAWPSLPGDRTVLVGLAAVVAWQGLVSYFFAVFVLGVALVTVAVRWRDLSGRRMAVGGAMGVATAVSAASYLPYLATQSQQEGFQWQLEDIAFLRAAPHIVEDGNSVWGSLLGRPLFGVDGFHAFPGLVVIALVLAGLVLSVGFARRSGSPAAPLLGGVITLGGVLGAMGPGWGSWTEWTPYALAFRFVPGFSAIRASGRFVLIVLLGFSVLAAVAVAEGLARREERRRPARYEARRTGWRASWVPAVIAFLLGAGITVEGLAEPRAVTPAEPQAVDRALARMEEPGGVLYLPIGFTDLADFDAQEEFVIRGAAHDRKMANGFAGFYPRSAVVLAERLIDLPDPEALDCLTAHDIVFVVMSERVGPFSSWAALRDPLKAAPLELVDTFGDELLYRVPDRQVAAGTCPLPGV